VFSLEPSKNGVVPHLERIIGHKNDIGVDITSLAIEAEVPIEFSKEAEQQAENTPNVVTEEDKEVYNKWNEAKKAKDFEEADKYRLQLIEKGLL
jgi:cysteinyl-tRNA synthetase